MPPRDDGRHASQGHARGAREGGGVVSVSACWAAAELAAQVTLVVFAAIGLATVESWLVESARLYRFKRGGRP